MTKLNKAIGDLGISEASGILYSLLSISQADSLLYTWLGCSVTVTFKKYRSSY